MRRRYRFLREGLHVWMPVERMRRRRASEGGASSASRCHDPLEKVETTFPFDRDVFRVRDARVQLSDVSSQAIEVEDERIKLSPRDNLWQSPIASEYLIGRVLRSEANSHRARRVLVRGDPARDEADGVAAATT